MNKTDQFRLSAKAVFSFEYNDLKNLHINKNIVNISCKVRRIL